MKKIILTVILGLAAIALSSCVDTLDTHPTNSFTEEAVWGSYSTASAFVNATYSSVLALWAGPGVSVDWESRTSLGCRGSQVGEGIDSYATETGLNRNTDLGADQSARLRRCNLIIEKAMASDAFDESEKKLLIAEGKFLRAMVFFFQARRMGRFLPIMQTFKQDDTDVAQELKMTSSIAESYKLIVADFEDAIAGLPERSSAGRANKYAAEVLLSKACLQAYAYTGDKSYLEKCITAGSDVIYNNVLSSNYGSIFNEEDPFNAEILLAVYRLAQNNTMDAVAEVQMVMPNIDVGSIWQSNSQQFNSSYGTPFNAWGIYWPTQELVDQYLAIDEESGEAKAWWETSQWKKNVDDLDPSTVTEAGQVDQYVRRTGELRRIPTPNDFVNTNLAYPMNQRYAVLKAENDGRDISELMYSNRDARFYDSIIYDNCPFLGETIGLNLGGNCSKGVRSKEDGGWYTTITNYMWRKGVVENVERMEWSTKIDYHWVVARTGEAYMNVAEACLLLGDLANALQCINATRATHGKLPPSTATTIDEAWVDYMRERSVEMCLEIGDMYFSQLRWGKYGGICNAGRAPGDVIKALDSPIYQVQIARDRSKVLINQVTLLNSAQRQFTVKRYLFPIAQSFLNTREAYGLDHEQNPGW